MKRIRFKKITTILDIVINALAIMGSVGIMLYGVFYYGVRETWLELILNAFYIACVIMIWMYFFNYRITTDQFNYWCTISLGMTVLLRDILFQPELSYFVLEKICFTLSVLLLCTLTYFYARKDWQKYTKRNLWTIFIFDVLIAAFYHLDIYLEPSSEYTDYFLTEIWIRPTITYGLVASFISEVEDASINHS